MEMVSIIIPLYNECKYIARLIRTLRVQSYDHTRLEILFIDGDSVDGTQKMIEQEMKSVDILYQILHNPNRNVSKSLNMGIQASHGEIIMRLDGHTEIEPNYIELNVTYLKSTGAANVGCLIDTKSDGLLGMAIAAVLSSPFGVGNSRFRIGAKSGYVDTVPFGCIWRSTFDKIGFFSEDLVRSEDNEFNSRILKNGGKIYLFDDIKTVYHPRDTIGSLMHMGYANGHEIIQTVCRYPESFHFRYVIPFLFVLFLLAGIVGSVLTKWIDYPFGAVLLVYVMLALGFSFLQKRRIKSRFLCGCISLLIYPLFHISYGWGSVRGLVHFIKRHLKGDGK